MTRSSESTTPMATKPGFPATGIPPAPAPSPTLGAMRPATAPAPAPRPTATDRRALVVGRGIALAGGAISDCERLEVHGTVEVSLNHALELSIAESGVFRGEAEIEEADISGAFDGAITANSRLVIRATGRVSGTIRCARLMIEEGAQVSGRIEMIAASAPPAQAPVPQASPVSAPDPYATPAEPAYART
ncbi:MAG: polymer-forming cytoskeletal protein [Acetobacteraceae bacterium]|jgi:cytoskeletal protein CcmA (bactofilin family)|nr:polymer-forming cytoskeletal protein [Acetobacteraceae bacterium]